MNSNAARNEPQAVGLYVHIPFCLAKCRYCDFNSRPLRSRAEMSRYVAALCRDLTHFAGAVRERKIISVYFGGGTPSLLRVGQLARILESIRRSYLLAADAEITLEANPGTVNSAAWSGLLACGVNRLSIGVQTCRNELLAFLGRIHTAKESEAAIREARSAGFCNISTDLMFGLPGQTAQAWECDLRAITRFGVTHVSCYDLTVEPGTVLSARKGTFMMPEAEIVARMYRRACRILARAGYRQYEISSFALPGKESRHNQLYWQNKETIGCGAGAYSYLAGTRFSKNRDIDIYVGQIERGVFRRCNEETLSPARRLRETLVLSLRRLRGISSRELLSQCGRSIPQKTERALSRLRQDGLVRKDPKHIRLTRKGILWYDEVAARIL